MQLVVSELFRWRVSDARLPYYLTALLAVQQQQHYEWIRHLPLAMHVML